MTPKQKTLKTHKLLTEKYGALKLVPRREPMHELISTMLSHRTTQAQEDEAFHKMWDKFGSWEAIMNTPTEEVAETIKVARFSEQKAPRIQKVIKAIIDHHGKPELDFLKKMPVKEAMQWLMDLPGVGIKTASLLMLFCYHKPVMPVDTHVHRISLRVGMIPIGTTADKAHYMLQEMLPKDPVELYNFHIHMLWHGQRVCTFRAPKHQNCPLKSFCNYYLDEQKEKSALKKIADSQQK